MRNETPKILPHNHMPRRRKLNIHIALDLRGDILLERIRLQSLDGDVDGVLLHLLGHVDVFDYGFGEGGL